MIIKNATLYFFHEKLTTTRLAVVVFSTHLIVLSSFKWRASLKLGLNSQIIAICSFQVKDLI